MLHHVTLAVEGRFPVDDPLRIAAITVRALGPILLLFAIVDEHAHVVIEGDRTAIGPKLSGWSRALAPVLKQPLEPTRTRPVADRAHLRNLVGYVIRQPRHHGAGTWDGTCLPDLVGARRLGWTSRIATLLPRDDVPAMALAAAGVPAQRVATATDEQLRAIGPTQTYAAALSAVGWARRGPRGQTRAALDVAWRSLSEAAGFGAEGRRVAEISERTWARLARAPDAALVETVRRRATLDRLLAGRDRPPAKLDRLK